MKASISANTETNELTITIEDVDWENNCHASFYAGEVRVRELLQVIGQALTVELLGRKDVTAPRVEYGGQTYYRKEATPGHYQTPYGEVVVVRHLYQSSAGGETLCPLERNCQLSFGSATPLLAEVVSFKLASQTARELEQDLAQCQGLALSDTYLRALGEQVGQLAVEKAGGGSLAAPPWRLRWRPLPPGWMVPRCPWSTKRTRKRCAARLPCMTWRERACTRST